MLAHLLDFLRTLTLAHQSAGAATTRALLSNSVQQRRLPVVCLHRYGGHKFENSLQLFLTKSLSLTVHKSMTLT